MAPKPKTDTPAPTAPAPAAETVPPVEDVTDAKPLDVKQLHKDLLAGIKTTVGKVAATEKQAYTRYNLDKEVVAYVRESKKGLLVTVEARVDSADDVASAVDVIAKAFALS